MTEPDRSGAGWSDGNTGGAEDVDGEPAHPFRIAAPERYQRIDVAGRGGMGEVLVASDRRLGREVALKRVTLHGDSAGQSQQLAREAWITARLEHPSIVPIHDAGESDDGRLYYTMRLIQGRSLADALREAPTITARLALLRHFLAACEAVAYAHSQGIAHRDLKPANIMVGGFGETQLVDWGLAGFIRDDAARAFAAELGHADGVPAGVIGTPAYMSPEQARGEEADARADVWALGAVLHELIVGERLIPIDDGELALRDLRAGEIDRSRMSRTPEVRELRAIVDKSTALDPRQRYRDAAELARDVARFLDGGRVDAHTYSALELVRRLVRQLRVPLMVVAAALVAGSVALALDLRRIERERARAVAAEADSQLALADSRRTSARALERQAVMDLARGAVAEAEVLAAHALAREESADARGVLAAARAAPRLAHAEIIELPACERIVPATWTAALCQTDQAVAMWDLEPARLLWRRELAVLKLAVVTTGEQVTGVLVLTAPDELVVLDAERGEVVHRFQITLATGVAGTMVPSLDGQHLAVTAGRTLNVISLADGTSVLVERTCGGDGIATMTANRRGFVVVCDSGEVRSVDPRTRANQLRATSTTVAAIHPMAVGSALDDRRLLVGGARGDVVGVDLETGVVDAGQRIFDGPILHLAYLDHTRQVLFSSETGVTGIWDLDAGTELLRVPQSVGIGLRVVAGGFVTGGRRAGRWALPSQLAHRTFVAPAGLAAVAVAPGGAMIAAARGDGRISIWDRASGALVTELVLGTGVVKSVDFSPDGGHLAAAISETITGPRTFETTTWSRAPLEAIPRAARRVAFTADGSLVAAHYAPGLSTWSPQGALQVVPGPEIYTLSQASGRREQLLLAIDGGVWRLRDRALVEVTQVAGATSIASWPASPRFATGGGDGIVLHGPGGATHRIPDSAGRFHELVVSPDARYLLGARSDGTIAVWRLADERLVATLRGHRQRVAHLTFAPDGALVSAGWDGVVQLWDLAVLDRPAAALVREAEARWGIGLELALDSSN